MDKAVTGGGFAEGETLKTATMMTSLRGVIGLITCLPGSLIFPMLRRDCHHFF